MMKMYKPCPCCTFPLTEVVLGIEDDYTIKRIYCTNRRCQYEKMMRRKCKTK